MEYEVSEGGGNTAKIEGYRIGGKTGTAQKAERGGYNKYDYYSSFICMAPMDNPQITLLVIVDSPRGAQYGSIVAAPCAKGILKNVMRYMAISPSTEGESSTEKETISVPDVVGMSYSKAEATLKEAGLKISRPDSAKSSNKWKVVDQYPKAGTKVRKKSTVYVYKE